MKNRFFMCNCKVPMRLQIFAEGDGAGAGEGGNGGGSGTGGEGEPGAGTEPMSFDDFLKGEGNQAEFDRRVQKAIETAVSNAQQKWQALADDKLSEAKIDFSDYTEAIPCFIAIIAMPFMYSISEGIAMGVISYVVLNVATGKAKEKKISILMYVLAVLFILKYVVL